MPVEEATERIDRYRTLNNAVFGLALGLGAFSLTAFSIHGLEDIIMAILLFAGMFIIVLGIWHDVHRMLKYPFDMLFAALDYLLLFLAAIMPFSFRLIFEFQEVTEIAATLYPLNVASAQIVLAIMYHKFTTHNRDSLSKEIILWGKESRNFVLIVAVFYVISLFLPSEVTLLPLPPEFPKIFQRLFVWWLGYPIAIIYGALYEKMHGIKWDPE